MPKKKKMLLIAVGAVALLAGGGAGGYVVFAKRAEAAATPVVPPALYHAMTPAFVVNLADSESSRYLQADVQLMTRDPETVAALELHAPAIRNRMLLLLGSQVAATINHRAGKEQLQKLALAEVRAVLKAEKAPDKVDALYFTSLVIQ
ncbi:flagellar basal body-associated protein FliL [Lysobacter korlensis]|uniref:Flagellar protein FliL n=1 Tax=Lysobacter korlensis TaxID=553636 RepID=A0ABV6RMD9_9GAMM